MEPNNQANTEKPKQLNHKLLQSQAFKVMQWLAIHRERLHRDCPSWEVAAKECEDELKFKVTSYNIRSVAKDSEQMWSPKVVRKVVAGANPIWSTIRATEAKLEEAAKLIEQLLTDNQQLHAQLAQVRGAVVTLAKEAKCSPPPFASRNDAGKLSVFNK